MASPYPLLTFVLLASVYWAGVAGHARLISPPSRASMWRFGYQNPPDYDDNQGFCGGAAVQWEQNGGKCGICGDSWSDPVKEHEAGGRYANGIIVGIYKPNQTIDVLVDVTANHLGYFSFNLCPAPSPAPSTDPSQECFDTHPLSIQGGGTRYYLASTAVGVYTVRLRLPNVECERCVMQWTYTTGNSWGSCGDGSGALGCGPQETFRACSDITLTRQQISGNAEAAAEQSPIPQEEEEAGQGEGEGEAGQGEGEGEAGQGEGEGEAGQEEGEGEAGQGEGEALACHGVGPYASVPGIGSWCSFNCNYSPPFCPPTHCACQAPADG